MRKFDVIRNRTKVTVLVAGLACCAAAIKADGPGHSFTSLTSPFTQELYGVTANPVVVNGADGFMGGVAFTPAGDVWGAECSGSQLHHFERQGRISDGHGGAVRPESLVDLSTYAPLRLGCGVVNHPVRYLGVDALLANTDSGLWPVDAATGESDPGRPDQLDQRECRQRHAASTWTRQPADTHVVYAGADCDPAMRPTAVACTLWDYNLTAAERWRSRASIARRRKRSRACTSSPDGSSVFVSYRDSDAGSQGLIVIADGSAHRSRSTIDDTQCVRRIPMNSMPQGVAFRTAGDFAVTLNERRDDDETHVPISGLQWRPGAGDLCVRRIPRRASARRRRWMYLRSAGPDGGRDRAAFASATTPSAPTTASRDVRRLRARARRAGAEWSPEPGSVSGSAFTDWNRNGTRDAGEPGLAGVQISMTGSSTGAAVTDGSGGYTLADVTSGLYSVGAPVTVGSLAGNPTPIAVTLGAGEQPPAVDFPYTESTQPVCTPTAPSGSPTRVDVRLRDGNGLRRIVVRAVSNFQVSISGGAPVSRARHS